MMMIQKLIYSSLFCALTLAGPSLAAQTFEVPRKVTLETAADYKKYEQDIVKAASWLETTDLDKERDKRKETGTFVIGWVSGSPDLTVEINSGVTKLQGDNTDLLLIFVAAYSKYCIGHKDTDKFGPMKAAVDAMIRVYRKGIMIEKNGEMDKVIGMTATERDHYIRENLVAAE